MKLTVLVKKQKMRGLKKSVPKNKWIKSSKTSSKKFTSLTSTKKVSVEIQTWQKYKEKNNTNIYNDKQISKKNYKDTKPTKSH